MQGEINKKKGFVVFLTGLSGAGKSTLATYLKENLAESTDRYIANLDGDIIRQVISSELGYTKEDRILNIQRISFIASEIAKAGGIVICSAIAPYRESRLDAREFMKKNEVDFIEVYVSTSIEVCAERDIKGLYKKAKAGLLKNFTGVNDIYEPPENPDVTIDTSKTSVSSGVELICNYIAKQKCLVTL
jgi:sulfate adenylyltransferase